MRPVYSLIAIPFVVLGVACSVTSNAAPGSSSGGPGSGGASGEQIDRCKGGCDKMKFFDCSSAEEQAACYADCDAATPQQIDVFTGCAENSICDPACRTQIKPADQQSSKGSGASTSSCSTACDKLIECSFIPLGAKAECNQVCASEAYQYQIDCVNKTACGQIKATCGDPTGESSSTSTSSSSSSSGGSSSGGSSSGGSDDFDKKRCESQCDSILFFDCSTTQDHAACRAQCANATGRDTFIGCSQSGGSDCATKAECLAAFLP